MGLPHRTCIILMEAGCFGTSISIGIVHEERSLHGVLAVALAIQKGWLSIVQRILG